MPKKKREKKIFDSMQIESAKANAEPTESTHPEVEAAPADSTPQEAAPETPAIVEQPSIEESEPALAAELPSSEPAEPASMGAPTSDASASSGQESSADDLLEDVRRSLMEEEVQTDQKKQKKWWRRIAKGLQKEKGAEPEKPVEAEMISPTPVADVDLTQVQQPEKEPQEYADQIDELIDMLEAEADEAPEPRAAVEVPAEPEPQVDIEEMKKQAFRPSDAGEEQENFSQVRSIALEGGEEVFVEVETKPQDPLEERLKAIENALKPYRTYINFAFAFLGAALAVVTVLILFNVYQRTRPPSADAVEPNLPFPTSISLPGGVNFTLGKGSLKDGAWNPRGPEWLEGTEVCRWVAIPWSRQLEAVIRTLNPDDLIELGMSNNDRLAYKVYSVQQLSQEEMQKLDSGSPCLLLVLAEADSEKRWVLTALP